MARPTTSISVAKLTEKDCFEQHGRKSYLLDAALELTTFKLSNVCQPLKTRVCALLQYNMLSCPLINNVHIHLSAGLSLRNNSTNEPILIKSECCKMLREIVENFHVFFSNGPTYTRFWRDAIVTH
jgi:hypothetical protein